MSKLSNTALAAAIDRYCKENEIKKDNFHKESKISSATLSQWRNSVYGASSESIARVEAYTGMGIESFIKEYGQKETALTEEDGDSMRIREILRDRPEARLLFNAAEDAPTSAILEAAALIMRYKEESQNK